MSTPALEATKLKILPAQAKDAAALPSPNGDPLGVVGGVLFNTGPFAADGHLKQMRWEVDRPVRLLDARIWWGAQARATLIDLHAELFDLGTGSSIGAANGDHYADGPFGAGSVQYAYRPYVYLPAGSGVLLNLLANAGASRPAVHCIVWGLWSYPPEAAARAPRERV